MNCCPNCFTDKEIIGIIESNSTQVGSCDYCGTLDTKIIPATELYNDFENLLLSYSLPGDEDIVDATFKLLHQHISDWFIFNFNDDSKQRQLIKDIGNELYQEQPDLFDNLVAPKIFLDPAYKHLATEYIQTWDNFKQEIKQENRFFIHNSLNFDNLKNILKPFEKVYKKGKLFYRARTSAHDGIPLAQMGKPPAKLATSGRANPLGISYLYLSNDIKTTLYEVRATLYDYITVADFKLIDEILVASLRNTEKLSPFILDNISTYLLYKQFIAHLEYDLIKPLRRHDSELDYLPTQYLCEFIKSLGYDGIEYSSSLNPEGFNVALFFDEKVAPVKSKVYEVRQIFYQYQLAES